VWVPISTISFIYQTLLLSLNAKPKNIFVEATVIFGRWINNVKRSHQYKIRIFETPFYTIECRNVLLKTQINKLNNSILCLDC
jgi:hypothetical protein